MESDLKEEKDLKSILLSHHPTKSINKPLPQTQLNPSEWAEIRLFISSTFVDSHSERDVLIQRIIPHLNRELKDSCIRIVPVDLRWGVLKEESKDCYSIQKTCLNEIDNCRQDKCTYPYFIGLRTQRYGWVQEKLLPSKEYVYPDLYEWVNILEMHGKELAITSLECIHAAWPREKVHASPTVFFYERKITNAKDIEKELAWIFHFEYQPDDAELDENVVNQYTKTNKAHIFQKDKNSLDQYLRTLDHVKYSDYTCSYEKGGARITGQSQNKRFGIGNVTRLEEFEKIVQNDLLNAIKKNFKQADLSTVPKHELANIPYEVAIKEKASTFVGRATLTEKILTHSTAKNGDNCVMIVVGDPGCGKSALVAYAANKCMKEQRSQKNFVFVHGADMCPQSNDLEAMLLRLHTNLCNYTGNQNTLLTAGDLRAGHTNQLEEIASEHPDQLFIIFIDAVNQLYEGMQSWRMWWLPTETSPKNLRIIISTLPDENKTYENALKYCTQAAVLNVDAMTREEGEEMVAKLLARYNKKLTNNDDDKFLRNQMALLLSKNKSPLYLNAACEALRTQGVYEKMTEYIDQLPHTIPDLVSFLLDSWSKNYGELFIRHLTCIITLSRDGLLENVISDILAYIEKEKVIDFGFSLSTVFSTIRGFLSSGGEGSIRFFHDQINQVVQRKYLTPDFEGEIHELLAGFYLEQITPQLSEEPTSPPPSYFEDCLHNVVHHQVAARKKGKTSSFQQTLRNIFFVREKVKAGQTNMLQKEYLVALRHESDTNLISSLQEWKKFSNTYAPFIDEMPQWSGNMAINQVASSYVYMDTLSLNISYTHSNDYPTYWMNKPHTNTDSMMLKYTSRECYGCATTSVEGNMVAMFPCYNDSDDSDDSDSDDDNDDDYYTPKVFVYDMSTAELLHQVEMKYITSLTFTNDHTHLWLGDDKGFVHVLDLTTGRVVWTSEERISKKGGGVIWMQPIGEHIVCGTDDGTVAFIDPTSKLITSTWKTGEWCNVYHYHSMKQLIFTGHDMGSQRCNNYWKCWSTEYGAVGIWSMKGKLVKRIRVKGDVNGLAAHPTNEDVVACVLYAGSVEQFSCVQLNTTSGEVMWEVEGGSYWCSDVFYTHSGDKVVCVCKDNKTLLLLDGEGNITNHVKGHSDYIWNIRMVPGTNHLLTAVRDGSYLFNLPTTPDQHIDNDTSYEITGVTALNNSEDFIITKCYGSEDYASEDKTVVERFSGGTLQVIKSGEVIGTRCKRVVAHPLHDDIVVVVTEHDLLFLNSTTLCTLLKHNVVGEGENDDVEDFAISKDGSKCVVALLESGTSVLYDITDLDNITTLTTFKCEGSLYSLYSSDIHSDGTKVVCGGAGGVVLFDVTTSQPIKTVIDDEWTKFVKFTYKPDSIIFRGNDGHLHMMTLDGVYLRTFSGKHYRCSPTPLNNSLLVTGNKDNSIHVHDVTTGQTLYKFYHSSSEGFRRFAYQPQYNRLIAGNKNGKIYVLESQKPL